MRILFLAPALPWPPHSGGSRRIASILERLCMRHDVALFALEGDAGSVEATIAAPLAAVRTSPYPGLAPRGRFGFWKQVLTDPLPKAVRQACGDEALHEAATLAAEFAPDVIIAEPIEMEPYLRACATATPNPKTMMGWIDVVALNIRRQTSQDKGIARRIHAAREAGRMERLERRTARWVDARTCVSGNDQQILQQRTGMPFAIAPNGVDTDHFTPQPGPVNTTQALFVGPLNFAPNRDGVAWFAEEILPKLGGVTLTVAGEPAGVPAPAGVGYAGRVADVRPVMARAGVVVVPLRSGSGTRLKILEALAMGKAVVSTSVGAEGLDVTDGQDILIRDDADGFAAAVAQVLSDADVRERLGAAGRLLVEQSYRWEATIEAIEAALQAEGARR